MNKKRSISAAPQNPTLELSEWARICLRALVFEIKTSPQYNLSLLKTKGHAHATSRISDKKLAFKKGLKALKVLKSLNLELIDNRELTRVIQHVEHELFFIKEELALIPKGRPSKSTELQLLLFYGTLNYEAGELVRFFDTVFNRKVTSFDTNKRGVKIRNLEFLKVYLTSRRHPVTNSPNNQAFQIKELRRTLKKMLIERIKNESEMLRQLSSSIERATKLASMGDDKFAIEITQSPFHELRVRRRAMLSARRVS